ncbi:unnamed protein product [Cyprideis torosa]|uniref:Uncharacterized protein n=1 Tax=Cyprideis torosa TaxID=163714 RepID=A0A7R8ZV98_9CRUS|nr:unnamed protein product [Cyprideis torosa]CAG0907228.1 unnamed protein product [Cyprideis torosa]
MKLKTLMNTAMVMAMTTLPLSAMADTYKIDTEGAHAFVQFRVQHLGYSWLYGRFNDFGGEFSYDEKDPSKASVKVDIDTGSVDSNHAERDKHLRSDDFLDVEKFPKASFASTSYEENADGTATLIGELTLHGVTKPVTLAVSKVGAGADPWGGYRRGFQANTTFALADFGIKKNLGPASANVEMILSVEGIRQ